MRWTGVGTRWLGAAVLLAAGCWSTQPQVKPPPRPEEYLVPPDEAKFSSPIEYPKGTLNTDLQKKSSTGPDPEKFGGSGGGRMGAGPGMGGGPGGY
jgi:hypothetical protein